jgi:hypothetical protein
MTFLLLACLQSPTSSPSFFATSKADSDQPGDSGDSGDSGGDTGDSGDSGDSDTGGVDTDTGSCDSAAGESCSSSEGRLGQNAAELSGEPGGFGCQTVSFGSWGMLLGLGLVVRSLRRK